MEIYQKEITLPLFNRGFHLITHLIETAIEDCPITTGTAQIFVKHTSAGLTINENAEPTVREDFKRFFNEMVSEDTPYFIHTYEGPDDMPAHIKSSLVGSSVSVPFTNGRFNLGTWQGIYLCEFRNRGGGRKIVVTILGK